MNLNWEKHRKQRLDQLRALAESKGGILLSTSYTNNKTKLKWRCEKGHEWQAIPTNVRRGHWCLVCGNERQGRAKAFTVEMMRKVAAKKGGECLSAVYRNTVTKLRWRCQHGHEWESVPGSILGSGGNKGTWCPICAGRLSKKDALSELAKLAVKRGGLLLSTKYRDAHGKLQWRCAKGHEWKAIADGVKRGGWCPVCSGRVPLTLKDMQIAAARYGGKCLSSHYENIDSPLRWRCAEGHEWEADPYPVRSGHWCPVCSQGVSERICRAIIERITGAKFSKQRPGWLKNSRGNQMELDGYAESMGVAFEYHGPQHYRVLPFFHRGDKHLALRQQDDALKRKLCREHGLALIEIPHDVPHQGLQKYLTESLDRLSGKLNLVQNREVIDIRQLDVWNRKRIEEMRAIATARGGKCLSDFYINNNTKLRWHCSKGHEWEAVPGSIKSGSWCGICGDKRAGRKRAHTVEEMRALAVSRGGTCLSTNYTSSKDRLRWRCAKGHEWEAAANPVIAGHWCPKCGFEKIARLFALTIEDMREAARKKGGECLSTTYENNRSRLRWRCSKGHEWEAIGNSIRNGTWCPRCKAEQIGKRSAHTMGHMKAIAAKNGGLCLSTNYQNNRSILHWRCGQGHEWKAVAMNIIRGSWCPICRRRLK